MTRNGRKYSALLQPSRSIRAKPHALRPRLPLKAKTAGGIRASIIKAPCKNSAATVSKDKMTDNAPEMIGNSRMTTHHSRDLARTNAFGFICASFRSVQDGAVAIRTSQPSCPNKRQRVYCYIAYFMIF